MTKKVLHIDDDPDIREIARISLEVVGPFTLLQCASGFEALEKATEFAPDVILMDVMMPELGGVETCARLKAMPELKDVPVIYMTAKAQTRETQTLMQTGAIGVITKPFDPMALPTQILDMISSST